MRYLLLTVLGMVLAGSPARADAPWTSGSIALTLVPTANEEVVLHAGLPAVPMGEGAILDRAQLAIQAAFAPGTEVQLWAAASVEAAPWTAEDGGREALVDFWIVDEPTGSLVLFTVTAYLRAAAADPEGAGVLLLRALGPDGEPAAFTADTATDPQFTVWLRGEAP